MKYINPLAVPDSDLYYNEFRKAFGFIASEYGYKLIIQVSDSGRGTFSTLFENEDITRSLVFSDSYSENNQTLSIRVVNTKINEYFVISGIPHASESKDFSHMQVAVCRLMEEAVLIQIKGSCWNPASKLFPIDQG